MAHATLGLAPSPPLCACEGLRQQGLKYLERALGAIDDDVGALGELVRHLGAADTDARHVHAVGGHAIESVEGSQVAPVVPEETRGGETGRRFGQRRPFVSAQRWPELDRLAR